MVIGESFSFTLISAILSVYLHSLTIGMKKIIILLSAALLCSQANAQSSFSRQVTDPGNLTLSFTNAGTIGDPSMATSSNRPSMQYPKGSGIEHLFEGGLWIGAKVAGQTAVSTASIDAASGYTTGAAGFEFTAPLGNSINQRSSLTSNNYYSSSAISHQDLLIDFTDKYTVVPGTTTPISSHNVPLGADVHLETYAWNYGYADYFVICNYKITNHSTTAWDSAYIGLWTDLIVRNVNVTSASGTSFFNKGASGWLDTAKAIYAYDYNGDPGYTNSYGAMLFLGAEYRNLFFHPDNASAITAAGYPNPLVNANFWRYKDLGPAPPYISGFPDDDVKRYSRMKTGVNSPGSNIFLNTADNRTQLLTVGPFVQIAPNETVYFTVAFLCAKQTGPSLPHTNDDYSTRANLMSNIEWAKRTYRGEDVNNNGILDAGEDLDADNILDRYILPSPPHDPHVKIVPGDGKIDIYWDNIAEASIDPISKKKDFEGYKLYRSNVNKGNDGNDATIAYNQIGQWDQIGDSVGYNNGFSAIKIAPKTFDGDSITYTYHYEMSGLLSGWRYEVVLTAFDEGDKNQGLDPLESSFITNTFNVFPGTAAISDDTTAIGVYPNPFVVEAAWDGGTATSHKIYFNHLPANCLITIYTQSGDVVTSFNHETEASANSTIDWYKLNGGNPETRVLASGEHAYDLLSATRQTISSGLYYFSVKDLSTGFVKRGQFVVVR